MYIQTFEIHKFKPLMHQHTEHLVIENIPKVVVICGDNGSGKSSLLREMTPFPATRTDYEKGGYKRLEIIHNKQLYKISSDFGKTNAHSFVVDDIELNPGGTGEVQTTLCESHFGITPLIQKLSCSKYKLTALTKAERKELIMKSYPGSLQFMLEYHRQLSSALKDLKSQQKLLEKQKAEIVLQMMDDSIYKELCEKYALFNKLGIALDKELVQYEQKYDEYSSKLNGDDEYALRVAKEIITYQIDVLKDAKRLLETHNVPLCNYNDIDNCIHTLTIEKASLQTSVDSISSTLQSIRVDIEKYESIKNSGNAEAIEMYQQRHNVITQTIESIEIDPKIPVITEEFYNTVESNLNDIKALFVEVSSYTLPTWVSPSEYASKVSYVREERDRRDLLVAQRESLIEDRKQKQLYLYATQTKIPKTCPAPCKLKSNTEDFCKSLQMDIDKYTDEIDQLTERIDAQTKAIAHNNEIIEAACPYIESIQRLKRFCERYVWTEYLLNGKTFDETTAGELLTVHTRFLKLMENAKNVHRLEKAKAELLSVDTNLEALRQSTIPITQLLQSSIDDKITEQAELTTKLDNVTAHLDYVLAQLGLITEQKRIVEKLRDYREMMSMAESYVKLLTYTELYEAAIDITKQRKESVTIVLLDLKQKLDNQKSLRDTLSMTIYPTEREISQKIEDVSLVADALSPTTGLPRNYTMKFLEAVFKIANKIIARVWGYDLSIIVSTDENFDYVFQLSINGGASVVKDISLGSKGQQSIINLAVTLALLIYRKFINDYPIQLDEIDDGLTPEHRQRLVDYLGELLHAPYVTQTFIVSHDAATNSSFNDAGVVDLSDNDSLKGTCTIISKRN